MDESAFAPAISPRVYWLKGPTGQDLANRLADLLGEFFQAGDALTYERTVRTNSDGTDVHEATVILTPGQAISLPPGGRQV